MASGLVSCHVLLGRQSGGSVRCWRHRSGESFRGAERVGLRAVRACIWAVAMKIARAACRHGWVGGSGVWLPWWSSLDRVAGVPDVVGCAVSS